MASNSLVELVRLRKEHRQGETFYSKPSERMGSLRPSMLRFQMSLGGEGANDLDLMR